MNAPAVFPNRKPRPDWPRLMSVEDAADYLSSGTSSLRKYGPQPRKLGARTLYDRTDLDRFADALAGEPLDAPERAAEGDDIASRVAARLAGK